MGPVAQRQCAVNTILDARKISKEFPGVKALSQVDFQLVQGEVHALAGENGAGKSTLIGILSGMLKADSGTITFLGRTVDPSQLGARKGIAVVPQELNLAPSLNVAQNIFLGIEPRKNNRFLVDKENLYANARRILTEVGLDIDPRVRVSQLSIPCQALLQVARAIAQEFEVLILDEPTSFLTEVEAEQLLSIVRKLRNKGKAVIYITHKLDEIFRVADRITVLRDGEVVSCVTTSDIDKQELISLMAGSKAQTSGQATIPRNIGQVVLRVKHLTGKAFSDVSFELRAGEILGFAGLVGAGRTEIIRGIVGADPIRSGTIEILGTEKKVSSPVIARREGLGLVPEDRKRQGIFGTLSTGENITIPVLRALSQLGVISKYKQREVATDLMDKFNVRAPSYRQKIKYLSGGNQQKAILARWVASRARILILDEPTRGVDVNAKAEIHRLIHSLAAEGVGVIVVSSELQELLDLCDRILAIYQGRLVQEFATASASQEAILRACMGLVS